VMLGRQATLLKQAFRELADLPRQAERFVLNSPVGWG